MKAIYLIIIFIFLSLGINAQAFMETPIEGDQGNEWIIVNYVDWDIVNYFDHNCGTKSYDGHEGTDFVIQSFKAMDDSVAVYAAAEGTVSFVLDGFFDRETEGDIAKELGNYLAIAHPNGYYSYYGHLKKNSIQVEVGEQVIAGQTIGYVGSSGNSTDPHLHFEVWFDSLYVVDPFSGLCGNTSSLFVDAPAYDTSLTVWEQGLHLKNDLTINDLQERIKTIEAPYELAPSSDESLNFWAHMYGLRKGKELKIEWYTPEGTEWFNYSFILDKDYWYYYYWSFINHEDLAVGTWEVNLIYDGQEITSETFEIVDINSSILLEETHDCEKYQSMSLQELFDDNSIEKRIYSLDGQRLSENIDILPSAIYLIQTYELNSTCLLKRWIP